MTRRVMLVVARPRVPQPPIYAAWNPMDRHADITLTGGNLIVSRSTTHASNWRAVRAAQPVNVGSWYWETTHTFTGTGRVVAGLATSTMALTAMIGSDVWFGAIGSPAYLNSVAGPNSAGQCHINNAVQVTASAVPSGTIVRHWIDLDSGVYRIAVGSGPWVVVAEEGMVLAGGSIFTFGSINGMAQAWYPIAACQRPTGTTCSVTVNFGASPFWYDPPPGVNAGLYVEPDPVQTPVYFSSEPFATTDKQEPANQQFMARIAADVEITRAASCWPWGGSTQSQRGGVQFINLDGALDHMAAWLWRDAPVEIYEGTPGQDFDKFELWAAAVGESLVFEGRRPRRAELVLADPLAVYDAPIQEQLYPEDHPMTSEIGRPIPITIGIPFGISGARMSPLTAGPNAFAWQHHDTLAPVLAGLGTIYDNGIDITSRCVAWPSIFDRRGVRVSTGPMPQGKVTIDAAGVSTTTLLTVVQQAAARLPAGRMAPLTIEQQSGGVAGIASWAGIYIREPQTILGVIRDAMDSVCGWACPTRDGTRLRLGSVRDPAGQTPVLALTPDNVAGDIHVEIDEAPNLTTRLAGRRNYSPHTREEIATSIRDPLSPSYDPNRVEDLMAEWRVVRQGQPIVSGSVPLSAAYAHARQAEFRGTLMQESAQIKAAANRACTLWFPTRYFIRAEAILGAVAADKLEPGDFVSLRWPRFGLDSPKSICFMVVAVRSRFWSRRVFLTLWGSLPRI